MGWEEVIPVEKMEPPIELKQGMVVGELTLVGFGPPRITEKRNRIQWLCECSCGRMALRTQDGLRRVLRIGGNACCYECRDSSYRGLVVARAKNRTASNASSFAAMFRRTGSLYSPKAYDTSDDLAGIGLPITVLAPSDVGTGVVCDPPQQNQWLFEIRGKGGWQCSECGRPFTTGSGCVRCLARVCVSCVADGAHVCRKGWEKTFDGEQKDCGLLDRRLAKLQTEQLKRVVIGKSGRPESRELSGK